MAPEDRVGDRDTDAERYRLHDNLAQDALQRVTQVNAVEYGQDHYRSHETDGDAVNGLLKARETAALLFEPARPRLIKKAIPRKSRSFLTSAVVPIHHISIV
jgi:hypothetical protein